MIVTICYCTATVFERQVKYRVQNQFCPRPSFTPSRRLADFGVRSKGTIERLDGETGNERWRVGKYPHNRGVGKSFRRRRQRINSYLRKGGDDCELRRTRRPKIRRGVQKIHRVCYSGTFRRQREDSQF